MGGGAVRVCTGVHIYAGVHVHADLRVSVYSRAAEQHGIPWKTHEVMSIWTRNPQGHVHMDINAWQSQGASSVSERRRGGINWRSRFGRGAVAWSVSTVSVGTQRLGTRPRDTALVRWQRGL